MALKILTEQEKFIAEIKRWMERGALLISNYEASLPIEDPDPVEAVFRDPDTGEVLWRSGETPKQRMKRANDQVMSDLQK